MKGTKYAERVCDCLHSLARGQTGVIPAKPNERKKSIENMEIVTHWYANRFGMKVATCNMADTDAGGLRVWRLQ